MNFLDILVENYDFTEPLEDEDILVLWKKISSGVQSLKVGENALGINSDNYAKISNFLSEGKKRKLFDDSEITRIEEFFFALKKLNKKTQIDSVHTEIRPVQKKIKIEPEFIENSVDEIFDGSLTLSQANIQSTQRAPTFYTKDSSSIPIMLKGPILESQSETRNSLTLEAGPSERLLEQCTICSAVFKNNSRGLKKHKEAIHDKIRFRCSECERIFNARHQCKAHILKIHHKSDIFPQKISLDPEINKCIQNHNADRYNCESCPKTFAQESKIDNPLYRCGHINFLHKKYSPKNFRKIIIYF